MHENRIDNVALTTEISLVILAYGYHIGALTPYERISIVKAMMHEAFINHLNELIMDKSKKKSKRIETFAIINPNAAGIDVADTELSVAVPADRCEKNVQTFGSFTCDLHEVKDWLKECEIETVAMESTGVYWVQLFLLLQEYGFVVFLVNAKHVKNVTGRKDDDSDASWIQKLHSCGLLSNSFQPDMQTRVLRSLVRHRKGFIRDSSRYLNRLQKALELMNIKVHTVISDIAGKTGQRIIQAILAGERDPMQLALLADNRIKAPREEIIKSLEGYWREEHLFELSQSYQMYQILLQKIHECDIEIEKHLSKMISFKIQDKTQLKNNDIKRKKSGKNRTNFNLTEYLLGLVDINVTDIIGISELCALEIIAETGTDMTKWKTEKHFTSWLGLAPNTKRSGGKIISSRIMKKKQSAGQAFRMAASTLYKSKSPLGDYYRRIRSHSGGGKAVVATARKLAIIFYFMIKNKSKYDPTILQDSQQKYKEFRIKFLEKQLSKLKAA